MIRRGALRRGHGSKTRSFSELVRVAMLEAELRA